MRTRTHQHWVTVLVAGALLVTACGGGTRTTEPPRATATASTEAGATASQPCARGAGDEPRPEPAEGVLPAVVDPDSSTLVALAAGDPSTTWTLDLRSASWRRRQPARSPVVGLETQLLHDPSTDLVLAWSPESVRFWAYDLDTDEWTPRSAGPHLRLEDAALDPRRAQVFLRDGDSGSVWVYDLTSDTWHRLPGRHGPRDHSPGGNGFYSFMVADPAGDELLLVQVDGDVRPGRTWRLDLTTDRWSRLPAEPPEINAGWFESGREIVLDEASGDVVLFSDAVLARFDPTTRRWRPPEPGHVGSGRVLPTGPLARHLHTLAYDPGTARVLLLGGQYRAPAGWAVACDVWAYETSSDTWTELVPAAPHHQRP